MTHAAFSRDGLCVATASLDRTVRIWDVMSGNEVIPPLTHMKEVTRVAFSPDARYILSASDDGTARVWDLAAAEPIVPPLEQANGIAWKGVSFSPDSGSVVTAEGDGMVKLWNAETGQFLGNPPSHRAWMCSVAFSPDGQRIVSAGTDGTARIWSPSTAHSITLQHKNYVVQARFSPDGTRVVTASFDGTARQWEASTGKEILPALQHRQEVREVNYSHDGARLVTASGSAEGPGNAQVWDAMTGQRIGPALLHAGYVESACFSADGGRVLTASNDGTARVWNAKTGEPLIEPIRHRSAVRMANFSPDGRRILTASVDGTARVWDSASGRPLTPPLKHGAEVSTATFSSDGRMIATASHDHTARLWDANTGDPLTPPFKHDNPPCISLSSDNRRVVTASGDGTARIRDLPRTDRPLPNLLGLAELLAGKAPDRTGGFVALETESFRKTWRQMQRRYSAEFAVAPKQVIAWHRRNAEECETARQWDSVVIHLDFLLKAEPDNPSWQIRRARAQGELDRHRAFPPRDPQAGPAQIDLSNYYNAELTEAWPLEVPGNDLSSLPNGLQPFAGVTFDIRGIVQLLGAGLKGQLQNAELKYPEQVSRIEVNRKCHRLHVLHGAFGSAPEGTQIGGLALHYATGYELVIPILFGEHLRDFWQPTSEPQKTEHGVIAWTGTKAASLQAGVSLRLYRTSWENPAPDVEIISIDFRSAMDVPAPFLIALTVE